VTRTADDAYRHSDTCSKNRGVSAKNISISLPVLECHDFVRLALGRCDSPEKEKEIRHQQNSCAKRKDRGKRLTGRRKGREGREEDKGGQEGGGERVARGR
jgi:hypothetical protein